MHRLVFQAASGCFRPHAAFADDQFDPGLFDKLLLEFFHAHAGGRPDGHHLEVAIIFLAHDGAGMEYRATAQVYR
ncbi:hypothetical protein D3C75_1197000 [compost metagenome]